MGEGKAQARGSTCLRHFQDVRPPYRKNKWVHRMREVIPESTMVGRETHHEEVRMKAWFGLASTGWIKHLDNLMLGSLLLAYLNTVKFGKTFPGVI